ncbi:Dual specificity protein phosphatase 14 [Pelomyxa schiedti]|nr:Dual specificity protein phosphatase 14 [Pelomyxa schiedti]
MSHSPADPAEILPGRLWLGSALVACNRDCLVSHGTFYVLNATSEVPNFFDGDTRFTYCRLGLDDSYDEDLLCHADTICNFINTAKANNGAVLVHCQAGISRSASAVLIYLMKQERMTLKAAHAKVQAARCNIGPNIGYYGQLIRMEKELFGSNTVSEGGYMLDQLVAMGFNPEQARRALENSHNRLNEAITFLITNV